MSKIKLEGSLTINEKEFRIDDTINDEVFIVIRFYDGGYINRGEKIAIGNRVLDLLHHLDEGEISPIITKSKKK